MIIVVIGLTFTLPASETACRAVSPAMSSSRSHEPPNQLYTIQEVRCAHSAQMEDVWDIP